MAKAASRRKSLLEGYSFRGAESMAIMADSMAIERRGAGGVTAAHILIHNDQGGESWLGRAPGFWNLHTSPPGWYTFSNNATPLS